MEILVPKEIYSVESTDDIRKITTNSSVFGILFKQLAKNIGKNRVKDFLFDYGWEMGVQDGEEALKDDLPLDTLIKQGTRLHIKNGHIRGIDHENSVEWDEDGNVKSVLGKGVWFDSYEAREYRKVQGIADEPVCHTLVGYSSGYMSTIFGKTLIAKELTCVGRGDAECRWVIKTKEDWERENEEELHLFEDRTIIKELSLTYEQLLTERKFLEDLANFQKKLTEEIANGSDLKKIVEMAYNILEVPIVIENTNLEKIIHVGLTDEKYDMFKQDILESMNDMMLRKTSVYKGKNVSTELQQRIVTPIVVQKKMIGYCSFIYPVETDMDYERDHLLLDRFANAISLILLNEKTEFESFERMKGTFLEQMINGDLPKNEIIKRGKYTGIDLSDPYYIVIIDYQVYQRSVEEEFRLSEQVYETVTRYFKDRNWNILANHHDGKITLCTTVEEWKESEWKGFLRDLCTLLNKKYKNSRFTFGISNTGEDIENLKKHYEEAVIANGIAFDSDITFFKDLGILGILLNSNKKNAIKLLAEEELGPVYHDKNSQELLKTLYIYLLNGGKLEKTMDELKLSMGGLRHRIRKLEDLLGKDLRNASDMQQLLLILQSLIALGELDIN